jgi:hypothetical protein
MTTTTNSIYGPLAPRALAGLRSLADRAQNPWVTEGSRRDHRSPGYNDYELLFGVAAGDFDQDVTAAFGGRVANLTIEASIHICGSGRVYANPEPTVRGCTLAVWSHNEAAWSYFAWSESEASPALAPALAAWEAADAAFGVAYAAWDASTSPAAAEAVEAAYAALREHNRANPGERRGDLIAAANAAVEALDASRDPALEAAWRAADEAVKAADQAVGAAQMPEQVLLLRQIAARAIAAQFVQSIAAPGMTERP